MGDKLAGVILVIFFTLARLMLIYYGLKAIISRKAEYNDGGTKTDYTGRRVVRIGTGMLVFGTGLLAWGVFIMVSLFF